MSAVYLKNWCTRQLYWDKPCKIHANLGGSLQKKVKKDAFSSFVICTENPEVLHNQVHVALQHMLALTIWGNFGELTHKLKCFSSLKPWGLLPPCFICLLIAPDNVSNWWDCYMKKKIRWSSISECTTISKGIHQNTDWQKLLIVTSKDFLSLSVYHYCVRRWILLFIISDVHGYGIMIYLGCNPVFGSMKRHLSDMHCLNLLSNVSSYSCQYISVNIKLSIIQ